ncbi:4443_t:CDS:2 [Funneliformis mosseae]|uniref:4443_t:CDS:1 n=1 Tax=Funneliformis mosseae TaxID=27381 RepID=A0A9N9GQD7_FUNMO|nr:4443_t:CDS:2 [Funneliformis mosseae]
MQKVSVNLDSRRHYLAQQNYSARLSIATLKHFFYSPKSGLNEKQKHKGILFILCFPTRASIYDTDCLTVRDDSSPFLGFGFVLASNVLLFIRITVEIK